MLSFIPCARVAEGGHAGLSSDGLPTRPPHDGAGLGEGLSGSGEDQVTEAGRLPWRTRRASPAKGPVRQVAVHGSVREKARQAFRQSNLGEAICYACMYLTARVRLAVLCC